MAHDYSLPVCLFVCFGQQGASSSNGATVPAAEPLKPKLQVGQNEIKKFERLPQSLLIKIKSSDGRLCFLVSEADGVPPAPPAKAGVHVGVAGAAPVSSRRRRCS